MAITKLNSLAIPAGTVEPADISYPLTTFSSTGIDDNATSTAITISSSENVTFVGEIDAGESRFFKPSTFWSGSTAFFGHNYGSMATQGNYDLHLTANGYRNSSGTWTSLAVNSKTGASQIALDPDGEIGFNTDATKANGDSHAVTRRMTIDSNGNVGIGVPNPDALLHVKVTEGSTGETDPIARFERFTTSDNHYLDITLDNSTNMIGFQSTGTSNGGFTFGGASSDLVTITSAGDVGIGTTTPDTKLQVSGNILTDEYQWNAGTGRRVSKYSGISSYWNQNEYIELFTIAPGGNSQNYFVEGCIKAQSSHSMDIVRFSVSVRSNTLPTLVYYAAYDRERIGTDFGLKPYIWYDTTNGVIKVAVKNTSTAAIHNAEFELNITARSTAMARDNVSYSGAERTAVTTGFTEQDTFILRKNSYVNDTYYFERHEQRPHLHGTPYGTDAQIATGMRVRQSNQLSFITDRVTVPIAGIYLITFNTLSGNNNQNRTDINIRVNGTTVSADLDMAQGSNDYSGKSTQVAVDLAANDYIQFYNTDWYSSTPSSFDSWQQVSITYIG